MAPVVDKTKVPWWVANLIVPLVNLILALLVSGLFIFIAGENPFQAVRLIIYGSFGYIEGFDIESQIEFLELLPKWGFPVNPEIQIGKGFVFLNNYYIISMDFIKRG